MKVYVIGGLGADERVFKYLQLDYPIHVLQWIEPEPHENLRNYAFRLSHQIPLNEEIILIGVSFGGMVAATLQNMVHPRLTILISSAKNKYELPLLYRWLGKLQILKLIPHAWLRIPKRMAAWLFDTKCTTVLFEIIKDTNLKFLKWAIIAISLWDQEKNCDPVFRIHGTKDKLIPYPKDAEVIPIKNGGHFIIVDRAVELSKVINEKIYSF